MDIVAAKFNRFTPTLLIFIRICTSETVRFCKLLNNVSALLKIDKTIEMLSLLGSFCEKYSIVFIHKLYVNLINCLDAINCSKLTTSLVNDSLKFQT